MSSTGAVFATSALLMCLELVEIRIMGFSHWFHFSYFPITLAMSGLALGGVLLAGSRTLRETPRERFDVVCLLAFAASSVAAMRAAMTSAPDTLELVQGMGRGDFLEPLALYGGLMLLMTVPFVFAGLLLCRGLMEGGALAHRVYAANLLGTALGAALFLGLIGQLGAYRLLYALAGAACLVALWRRRGSRRAALVSLLLALASLPGVAGVSALVTPSVDPSKNIGPYYPAGLLDTSWSPMFRTDVSRVEDGVMFTIDGDSETHAIRTSRERLDSPEPFLPIREEAGRHAVWRLVPPALRERALVIGVGGALDAMTAWSEGFREIDAVDVEPARIAWLKGKYADVVGGIFKEERVRGIAADGREHAERSPGRYDAIVLYNVDSLAGVVTGAYNLTENYLYTVEGVRSYLRALRPHGVVQLSRHEWGGPSQMQRLFNTFAAALQREGLDPRARILVVRHSRMVDFLASKAPFEPAAVSDLLAFYSAHGTERPQLWYAAALGRELNAPVLQQLMDAAIEGSLEPIYRAEEADIRPVTDDRPFFFEDRKLGRVLRNPLGSLSRQQHTNWSGVVLAASMCVALPVFLLMCGWTVACAWKERRDAPAFTAALFFAAIGAGYMLVQMALIQRSALLLGHPVRAMALVIPALLGFMGISCALSGSRAFSRRASLLAALASPVAVLLAYEHLLAVPLRGLLTLPLGARGGFLLLALGAIGAAAGFCFPLGLRVFQRGGGDLSAVAWAANGAASTIGALLATGVSLMLGFRAAVHLAVACYAAAFLLAAFASRDEVGAA